MTRNGGWSRSIRWPPGPTRTSPATKLITASPVTRCCRRATCPSDVRRPLARWHRARTPGLDVGPGRTRSSAGCTPEMAKDQDELYGLTIRGTDRVMPYKNPYRTHGELSEVEQQKLDRPPLDCVDSIINVYSKEGPSAIAKIPGEMERLKWGRHLGDRDRESTRLNSTHLCISY